MRPDTTAQRRRAGGACCPLRRALLRRVGSRGDGREVRHHDGRGGPRRGSACWAARHRALCALGHGPGFTRARSCSRARAGRSRSVTGTHPHEASPRLTADAPLPQARFAVEMPYAGASRLLVPGAAPPGAWRRCTPAAAEGVPLTPRPTSGGRQSRALAPPPCTSPFPPLDRPSCEARRGRLAGTPCSTRRAAAAG